MGINTIIRMLGGKKSKPAARPNKILAKPAAAPAKSTAPGIVKMRRQAAELVCTAAQRTFPDEFIAELRIEKGVITELIIVPHSIYGQDFSVVDEWMRPINLKSGGSVHSHPDSDNRPARQDARAFSKEGGVHLIIGYPYRRQDIAAYDARGRKLELKIIN